jgi:hypothetical protein
MQRVCRGVVYSVAICDRSLVEAIPKGVPGRRLLFRSPSSRAPAHSFPLTCYFSLKLNGTVIHTGTGPLFMYAGVNRNRRAASSAASFKQSAVEYATEASRT